jgi:negative regulator of flagellin synthesis FlgM
MVTEVNNNSNNSAVTALASAAAKLEKTAAPVSPPPAAAGNQDVVELTGLGSRLQELTQAVADLPEVDKARVARARQALGDGSYQVEPEAVADKLLAMENLLGSARKS